MSLRIWDFLAGVGAAVLALLGDLWVRRYLVRSKYPLELFKRKLEVYDAVIEKYYKVRKIFCGAFLTEGIENFRRSPKGEEFKDRLDEFKDEFSARKIYIAPEVFNKLCEIDSFFFFKVYDCRSNEVSLITEKVKKLEELERALYDYINEEFRNQKFKINLTTYEREKDKSKK